MSVKIDTRQLDGKLKTIEKTLKNPDMFRIVSEAEKYVLENINSRHKNKDGSYWKATWKSGEKEVSTRPYKRGGSKMLLNYGNMRNAINKKWSNLKGEVYCNSDYAIYHQNGKGRMKRQFMFVDNDFIKWLDGFLLRLVQRG